MPSTSTTRDPAAAAVEKRKKELKKERKAKDRLDFDFPTNTAFVSKGKKKDVEEREAYDVDESGRDAWNSGGHVNFFADLERDVGLSLVHECEVDVHRDRASRYRASKNWPRRRGSKSWTSSRCISVDRTRRPNLGIPIGS